MWEILMDIVQDEAAGEIICILDALDECEEKHGSGRYMLIEKFQKFHHDYIETTNSRNTCFKILVTSRPYIDIERRFKSLTGRYSTIRLSGDEESVKISKEIDLVIEEKVNVLSVQLDLDNGTTSGLKEKLLSMEHRTYLWLRLIFEVLEQQLRTTKRYLLHVIEELPETVDEAYETILTRIPKNEFERARRLLSIIVVAERPLLVQEINVALEIDENLTQDSKASVFDLDLEPEAVFRAALGNICGLFVTVADSQVFLIHQTARSFLLSNRETRPDTIESSTSRWKESVYLSEAHLLLSKICVSYLLFHGLEQDISGIHKNWLDFLPNRRINSMPARFSHIPEYSLIPYASGNWWKHLLHTNLEQGSPIYEDCWMLCNTNHDYFKIWVMAALIHETPEALNRLDSLQIAAYLGLDFVAQRALQSPILSYRYSYALVLAIYNKHENIVQTILETGKIDDLDRFLMTAIMVEKRYNIDTLGTIRLLVKYGAGNQDLYRRALTAATDEGLTHLVRFFVEDCGADPLENGP
ncbi:putative ankyrin repeat-containing protein [Botrytis cinerea BcDW1]|uniref:Putative ankyrin repeat-containing protein n=1 Tax=Botryotinia fuckeliana (strain BcDW1) TaxID=1290391 RepID=M7TGT0_BOTF1|nr:putative ankyrin repeat-containing protein [Botrytis cinerea BcDW1]